jgi:peptide-methionine (S)-S-oxide reductase
MKSQTGTPQHHSRRRARGILSVIGLLVAGVLAWPRPALVAEAAVVVPPPAVDEPASGARSETAVLAGGCFWGVQGVFQHVRGVTRAVSGYSGGTRDTAQYETVSRGHTGHAESVEITYDPSQISYGRLLQIYFSVVHDPTELNRQGPDTGTQYRSVIFAANGTQEHVAQAYIEQLGKARVFKAPIVTKVDKLQAFYPAEDYHQNFLVRNPYYPYIAINDMPKVEYLKRLFSDLYRAKPVLVAVP